MALNVNDVIAGLDPVRRQRVKEQAAVLIADEMTVRTPQGASTRHQSGPGVTAGAAQRSAYFHAAQDRRGDGR